MLQVEMLKDIETIKYWTQPPPSQSSFFQAGSSSSAQDDTSSSQLSLSRQGG
jgi:hypothetical protein